MTMTYIKYVLKWNCASKIHTASSHICITFIRLVFDAQISNRQYLIFARRTLQAIVGFKICVKIDKKVQKAAPERLCPLLNAQR